LNGRLNGRLSCRSPARLRGAALAPLAAALLLACAGAVRTAAEPAGKASPEPVAFTTVAQSAVPGQSGGAVQEVARDEPGYQALWAGLGAGKAPPAVDFARRMVVVVALPTQSCVAKVTIRGIAREPGGLAVDVLEQYPGPQCRCIVASRPFHVVALDRQAPGAVRFDVTRGPNTC
jgi:hypothetical protein